MIKNIYDDELTGHSNITFNNENNDIEISILTGQRANTIWVTEYTSSEVSSKKSICGEVVSINNNKLYLTLEEKTSLLTIIKKHENNDDGYGSDFLYDGKLYTVKLYTDEIQDHANQRVLVRFIEK